MNAPTKDPASNEWKLPWEGGCRCRQVRFRVTKAPLLGSACHCTGCQSMTSSAFSLTLSVPSDGFEVTQGQPVIGGMHGPQAHHFFCENCKTWMFTRAEGADWFVNVRPSMLDEHRWFVPYFEVYTAEKLPWATTSAKKSFEKAPDYDLYEKLMAEYAEHGVRP